MLALPNGTVLNGQYEVLGVLGRPGGFGVTYRALDLTLQTHVAVKEFLPRDLVGRSGDRVTVRAHSEEENRNFLSALSQFLQEARNLARISHPNVVRVRTFFQAFGTAYLVMDYVAGGNLADHVERRGGRLPPAEAVGLILPVLDGLGAIHAQHILHRDVKPDNVCLTEAHVPVLIDFGAARQAVRDHSRALTSVVSAGYAPVEQYMTSGQGTWTDVYACAALLYWMVTGTTPPAAPDRVYEDDIPAPERVAPVPRPLSDAILKGMTVDRRGRPQTVADFARLLRENVAAAAPDRRFRLPAMGRGAPAARQEPPAPAAPPAPGKRGKPAKQGAAAAMAPPPAPPPPAPSLEAPPSEPRPRPRLANLMGTGGERWARGGGMAFLAFAVALVVYATGWTPFSNGAAIWRASSADSAAGLVPVDSGATSFTADDPPSDTAAAPVTAPVPVDPAPERPPAAPEEPEPPPRREPTSGESAPVRQLIAEATTQLNAGSYADAKASLARASGAAAQLRTAYPDSAVPGRLERTIRDLRSRVVRSCEADAIDAIDRGETPPDCTG